jgi:hypothetical protein
VFSALCRGRGPPPPPSQKARERNYPSHVTAVYRSARSFFSAATTLSPSHGFNLPMTPLSTPAGIRGIVVNYVMFPFSRNPSAHNPPCETKPHGWLLGVYESVHKLRSGFWHLDLADGGSEKGTFNLSSEFSMETHMLEFAPKTVGQHHGYRTDPCWWGRSF